MNRTAKPPAFDPEHTKFVVAEGHPRLWIRPRELERFRRESGAFRRGLRKQLLRRLEEMLANPEADSCWKGAPEHAALALGQAWRLTGDERYAKAAWKLYQSLEPFVARCGGYNAWGLAAQAAGILYDWLHPYWKQQGLERTAAQAALFCGRRALDDLLRRYIVDDWHNYSLGLQSGILAAALAVGADHPDLEGGALLHAIEGIQHSGFSYSGARIQDMFETPTTTMNLSAALAARENAGSDCLWESAGSYHQVDARAVVLMAELWTRAGKTAGDVVWPELRRAGDALLLTERPDGKSLTFGDSWPAPLGWRAADILCALHARTPDALFAERLRQFDIERTHPLPIIPLLYAGPDVLGRRKPVAAAPWPLSGRAGRLVLMRSGWKSTDTFVSFSCGDFGGWHNHHDWNTFTIFRGGELAADTPGCYYAGGHRHDYQMRTIAHNGILVRNPREKFWIGRHRKPVTNDGGQRFVSLSYAPPNACSGEPHPVLTEERRMRLRDEFNTGKLIAFEPGESFDYVAGDATRAYTYPWSGLGDNPSRRVEEAVRQIVFLKPDWIVIFDRVEATQPEFIKSWLLHTMGPPKSPGVRIKPGVNRLPADGPFEFEELDGRMTLWPLLPQARIVRCIGGKGFECWVEGVDGRGRNHAPEKRQPGSPNWRLELSPHNPATRDCFLTVVHAGLKADPRAAARFECLSSKSSEGFECRILDRKAGGKTGAPSELARVTFGSEGPVSVEVQIPGECAYHRNAAPERVPKSE